MPETIELWYTVRTACTTAFATGAQKTAGRASGSQLLGWWALSYGPARAPSVYTPSAFHSM